MTTGGAHHDLALVTTTALEATVVVAAFAVHLWRFVPSRRALDLALLLGIAGAGLLVVPELAPLAAIAGALVAAQVGRVPRVRER
jgi:hypothetical protein